MKPRSSGRIGIRHALVLSLVAAVIGIPVLARAATVVVTDATPAGWTAVSSGAAIGSWAEGPGAPSLGAGSYHQAATTTADQHIVRTAAFNGTPLGSVTSLSYATYVTRFVNGQAASVRLLIDNDGNGSTDDHLVFEPAYQNATYPMVPGAAAVPNQCPGIASCARTGAWQTWNAHAGGWWARSAGNGGPPLDTLAHYLVTHPGAKLATDEPSLRLQAGDGWTNYAGAFDAVTIGIAGNITTYDFEAGSPTTVVVYPQDLKQWTFATTGGGSGAFAAGPGTPPAGLGSFRQRTPAPNDRHFADHIALNGRLVSDIHALEYSTYTSAAAPRAAVLQLLVDIDGDGIEDETLKFEPGYQTGTAPMQPGAGPVPNQCVGGCVPANTWKTWDADAGGWWVTGGGPPLTTLQHYADTHPGARVVVAPAGLRIASGSSGATWAGYEGFFDRVRIDGVIYDFEPFSVDIDCTSIVDDVAAIQAAVSGASNGATIRLNGICDFTRVPAHGGDLSSVANTGVLIRPGSPVNGLTIESGGASQSATILGSGLQAAFTVAPGNTGVTIRGLTFLNLARAVVAVNTTGTTVGFNSGTVPDTRGNRIIGSATMGSAILGLAVDRGPSVTSPTGTITINYGEASSPATFTGQGSGALRNFTVAGNYISFAPPGPGVPDVVAVDVRQRYERIVDGVLIRHNAVGMSSPVFPITNQNAIKIHSLTPLSGPATGSVNDYYIRNVVIDGNNLGRLEEIGPFADLHAAGRVGIGLTGVGNFTVTDNGVRVIESPTVVPMPGGGIVVSDSGFGRIGPGNVVNVIADPSTLTSDFGAIGVVDDIGTLFGDPAKPQPTRDVLVEGNVVGTLDPSTDGIAQRGIVVANAELITVRNNRTELTTDAALNIAPVLEGPGSPSAPGPVRLPAAVRASTFCGNDLDGTIDDPNEISYGEGGPGSVANSFPAGVGPDNGPCTAPALVVAHSAGSTDLAEAIAAPTDDYTVRLAFRPSAAVTVTPVPDTQVTVIAPPLVFTPLNWNVPQTVTVAAVDDALVEGGHIGTVAHTIGSTDAAYNGLSSQPLIASITDNDFGQILVTPQTLTVTEGGATQTYAVSLSDPPPVNVTVKTKTDAQVSVSPSTVTFTTANYAIPQTIIVTAVNDLYRELPKLSLIEHSSVSQAAAWNGLIGPGVLVTVLDNDPPNPPAISAPASAACVGTNAVTFTGTAEPNGTVELFEGATLIGTAAVGPTGAWSIGPVAMTEGVHQVRARTIGFDAMTGPLGAPRTFHVDTVAPAAPVVTSPTDGQTITGTPITLTGTAEPFARILIRRGTSLVSQTVAGASGSWTATAALPLGPHALTVTALDCAQNESAAAATLSITIAAPTPPTIVTPAEGSFQPATVIVTGTGPSGGTITLRDAGVVIQTGIPIIGGVWQTTRTFADGVHTLTATTVAGSLSSAPSAVRTFNVDTTPPTVSFDQPNVLGLVQVALPPGPVHLEGTGADNIVVAGLTLTYFDLLTGAVVATGSASCAACPASSVDWSHDQVLLPGAYRVVVTATDGAGLTATDEIILISAAV